MHRFTAPYRSCTDSRYHTAHAPIHGIIRLMHRFTVSYGSCTDSRYHTPIHGIIPLMHRFTVLPGQFGSALGRPMFFWILVVVVGGAVCCSGSLGACGLFGDPSLVAVRGDGGRLPPIGTREGHRLHGDAAECSALLPRSAHTRIAPKRETPSGPAPRRSEAPAVVFPCPADAHPLLEEIWSTPDVAYVWSPRLSLTESAFAASVEFEERTWLDRHEAPRGPRAVPEADEPPFARHSVIRANITHDGVGRSFLRPPSRDVDQPPGLRG
eukprot:Polyplicarium_translucidae@DN3397_c0_g1_i2.p1